MLAKAKQDRDDNIEECNEHFKGRTGLTAEALVEAALTNHKAALANLEAVNEETRMEILRIDAWEAKALAEVDAWKAKALAEKAEKALANIEAVNEETRMEILRIDAWKAKALAEVNASEK